MEGDDPVGDALALLDDPNFVAHATLAELAALRAVLQTEVAVAGSWRDLARPAQLAPGTPGSASPRTDWLVWLLTGGRGGGKTRAGAEWAAEMGEAFPGSRIALVAPTFADGRDTQVEGESGLLAALEGEDSRRVARWNRSQGLLVLRNGTRYQIYSAEKPRKLRGPQHGLAWCDELPEFADANLPPEQDSTWSNLLFGLRLGPHPRIVVTCTPKPVRQLKALIDDPTTVVTRGTTWENLDNLSPVYRSTVVARYEGTRLGQQELEGELLEAVEGALWTPESLERNRRSAGYASPYGPAGGPRRMVVAVDPSVGDGSGDECGIVVACLAGDGNVYIVDDASLHASPSGWASRVADVFTRWDAHYVVAEANQGGEMVRETLLRYAANLPIRLVRGKAGKRLRAEPVSLLWDQQRVWLAGRFPELEAQMTAWRPLVDTKSPDRIDAAVYGCLDLLPVESNSHLVVSGDVWEGVR